MASHVSGLSVVGVVTAQKQFQISYSRSGVTNVLHADFESYASKNGVPVVSLGGSMGDESLYQTVAPWRPDVFLVVGWYHMIPKRWRSLAPAYGLHASLLPDYAGGAPLVWAMINGETRAGITLFQMDDGVDTGPIAAQVEEEIHHDDTIATLYERIESRGLDLLADSLPKLAAGCLALYPQPSSGRRSMPQRSPADGVIDWSRDATFTDRWIRAQTRPYPGAFTYLGHERLTLWRAAVSTATGGASPGRVRLCSDGTYDVACGGGAIKLIEVTHGGTTYQGRELSQLFGRGGQLLGDPSACLGSCGPS